MEMFTTFFLRNNKFESYQEGRVLTKQPSFFPELGKQWRYGARRDCLHCGGRTGRSQNILEALCDSRSTTESVVIKLISSQSIFPPCSAPYLWLKPAEDPLQRFQLISIRLV